MTVYYVRATGEDGGSHTYDGTVEVQSGTCEAWLDRWNMEAWGNVSQEHGHSLKIAPGVVVSALTESKGDVTNLSGCYPNPTEKDGWEVGLKPKKGPPDFFGKITGNYWTQRAPSKK